MGATNSAVSKPDGSLDWSGGVDSIKTPTIASQNNPNGLLRNQLAWLINGTVRDGGITTRWGWQPVGKVHNSSALYQGGYMYQPLSGTPYLIYSISGAIFRCDPLTGAFEQLSDGTFTTGVPYPGPHTITIKNIDEAVGSGETKPAGYPAVGDIFSTTTKGYSGVLGKVFTDFTVPAVGQAVVVTLGSPYRGSKGNIKLLNYSPTNGTPYTVTLKNINHKYPCPGINPCPDVNQCWPTIGEQVTQSNVYYNGAIGSSFTPFTVPSLNNEVTVTLAAASPVSVGQTIHLFTVPADDPAQSFTCPTTGQPITPAIINAHDDWLVTAVTSQSSLGSDWEVLDFTPRFLPGGVGITPSQVPNAYFCQAEEFLIIQPGDGFTLPFFWDGEFLRRSLGITDELVVNGTPGINEIPAAYSMDYYMGRVWYSTGRKRSAGDIVNGPSGTAAYDNRDSVLNVTENPLAVGGDGFSVPDSTGDIVALKHSANLNTQLGQGQLYTFTLNGIYGLDVPVSRQDWINSGNQSSGATNMPTQTVVQLANGSVNDRCIVPVNGDLFYQSQEPGVRSLVTAVRNFGQWGNTPISAPLDRAMRFVDRTLMRAATGINFQQRLWQAILPKETPQGIVNQAVAVMDFMPISSLGSNQVPVWESVYEGLDILQLFTGNFNGVERAFAFVVSRDDGSIWLWEMTGDSKTENGYGRVTMQAEFPAFTGGDELFLKRLISGEIWVDHVNGTVDFTVDYRPDGETCWIEWQRWQICEQAALVALTSSQYPVIQCGPGYRATLTLPVPPVRTEPSMNRPSDIGYQFQVRVTVKGYCRIRGMFLHFTPVERKLYEETVA